MVKGVLEGTWTHPLGMMIAWQGGGVEWLAPMIGGTWFYVRYCMMDVSAWYWIPVDVRV
jgi:hypothetical protein